MATENGLSELAAHGSDLLIGGGALAAVLAFLRWMLGLAGGRQDARIAKLEAKIEQMANDRQRVQQDINAKLMGLGQGMIELMTALERLDSKHVSLERARRTLTDVFPIKETTPDHSGN